MRSSTTRLLIVLLAITMAAIIGTQVHWMQQTYSYEKNEFNTAVVKCIRGLHEDIELLDIPASHLGNDIEHPEPNEFLFRISNIPPKDTLVYYLNSEFNDFDVYTDCHLTVFNAPENKIAYEAYLNSGTSSGKSPPGSRALPVRNFSYVHLYFPHRSQYIITQMNTWIYTSAFLLFLLIGLAMAIYYLFRQKFLNEVQKDFINNVTHEFSTPLTVIDLSTDALNKPGVQASAEKINKYATTIRRQTDYLKTHIQNLINTVVSENYNFTLKKTAIVPNEILRQAVQQLEPLLVEKKGSVELDLEENDLTIRADPDNLYLAIFNIINNAIKYSAIPTVKIRTSVTPQHFNISIKDNGIGIEPDDLKKIFRKFYRAQKGNLHQVKGLGLGLYFTKKVVDLHHGSIHVNSIPGVGTEFSIDLPVNTNHS
ncbi:sensor histidine kinase [Flavihumibacter petaseus]|uniref:histidine kinase n=1 Tax=Flavihumibacter petaseus NBRC 106054 TaxID=1220578 RepID=A0A0E9MV61_9BACT|nr:HAMP domain-containing sensor histidine kinase [Flavihumibacter petaseus]GAO41642.1 putative two-component histidine kinase [Flavihumibacter petaseus NBRC 106054]